MFSGIIGFTQYTYEKGTQINSYILVSLGATIFSYVTSITIFDTDIIFMLATIVIAISFLATGFVIKTQNLKKDFSVSLTLWIMAIIGAIMGTKYYALGIEAGIFVLIYFFVRRIFMKYSQTSHQKYFAINLEILKLNTIDAIEELAEKCRFQILSKSVVRSDNFHFEMEYMAHPLAHRVFLKKLFRIKDFGTIVKISS
jgi:uncharacterized membrane protein YhiD involved in acid resistance